VAPNESPEITRYLTHADVIVSCANQLEARLWLEQEAIRLQKSSLQASAQDGRQALGGLISLWTPKVGRSCFGCLFTGTKPRFHRGEVLLPTVTRMIGDLAAHLTVQVLSGKSHQIAQQHNIFLLDAQILTIERLSVKRRPGCPICGDPSLFRRRV